MLGAHLSVLRYTFALHMGNMYAHISTPCNRAQTPSLGSQPAAAPRADYVICSAGHPGTLILTVTNAIKGTIWRSELRKTHLQTLPQRLDGAVTM